MAEEAGVDRVSIRDWLKQKEELLKKRLQERAEKNYNSWDKRRINKIYN